MGGTDPRFPYAKFREAILFAMKMANPNSQAEEATFIWDTVKTFNKADAAGRPFRWDDTPTVTTTASAPVHIDCVVEYVARVSQEEMTSIGEFTPARVIIYVMKEEYASITGATKVEIGGNMYVIKSIGNTISLFEFDMYPIYAEAMDES